MCWNSLDCVLFGILFEIFGFKYVKLIFEVIRRGLSFVLFYILLIVEHVHVGDVAFIIYFFIDI